MWNQEIFMENLTWLRKINRLTQEQLALKVGVSRESITKWETKRVEPAIKNLVKLAEVFNVSADKLLGVKIENNQTVIGMFELLEEYLDDQCDNISFLESDYRAGYEQALEDVSEFVSDLASEGFSLQDMYDEYSRHC
ncbi:MAG: helix-turn-helix transcriptional regulator [Streptococcus gallolyticus]|uniref:Helix-turn-helix transcriptional regulator n=1 Tax=Streptococcus gallolyticus TaxID=315405 RepID=A0A927XDH0_9STRE|nr:helix-turn-helix transcriptional regulator [Streptococcus gallolyticus]